MTVFVFTGIIQGNCPLFVAHLVEQSLTLQMALRIGVAKEVTDQTGFYSSCSP